MDVETETYRDWKISWMSRPRLIETEKFLGFRDRDSSRLGNLMDVETETSRDWAKDVDTETPSRLSLISDSANRHVDGGSREEEVHWSVHDRSKCRI